MKWKDDRQMDILQVLAKDLSVPLKQIESAVTLMDEGNTIPFIARYRKEATGGLDDTVLRNLSERLSYLRNLEKRKEEVLGLIEQSGKLDEKQLAQMKQALEQAQMLSEVRTFTVPISRSERPELLLPGKRGYRDWLTG